ncbi:MAG: hypothetical protein ABEI52_12000, partial [Halobacteriaceae archaeon]
MTSRRDIVTLATVFLIVLAGCGGSPGDTTTTTTTETISGDVSLPPGLSQSEITNVSKLTRAHQRALAQTGFEVQATIDATINGSQGTVSQHVTQRNVVESGYSAFLVNSSSRQGKRTATFTYWGNESTALYRVSQGQTIRYRTVPQSLNISTFTSFSDSLGIYLTLGDYSVTNVNETGEETLITLQATRPNPSPNQNITSLAAENVSSYTGTVVVDSSGVVHSLNVNLTATTSRGDATYSLSYELVRTGKVNVPRPDWIQEALASTIQADFNATLTKEYVK